jgi:four helix bundle protein
MYARKPNHDSLYSSVQNNYFQTVKTRTEIVLAKKWYLDFCAAVNLARTNLSDPLVQTWLQQTGASILSVGSNSSEGCGKGIGTNWHITFLSHARGSAYEAMFQLQVAPMSVPDELLVLGNQVIEAIDKAILTILEKM